MTQIHNGSDTRQPERILLAAMKEGTMFTRLLFVTILLANGSWTWQVATAEPPSPGHRAEVLRAIGRGNEYLLKAQNKDGSWGSARNTKDLNIYAPVPGAHHAFRSAVTSLCLSALLEQTPTDDARIQAAIDRGETWLLRELPRLRRATPDALYNIWGHGYALTTLSQLHHRRDGDSEAQAKLLKLAQLQLKRLQDYESVDGGWGYYDFKYQSRRPTTDATPFMTATVLVGLDDAKKIGLEVPKNHSQRAIDSILRQQKTDLSYFYGEYLKNRPMQGINRPGGSLGRSQACNIALRRWHDSSVTNELIKTWLQRLLDRNGWLDMGRKRPIPHESHMQVAGYFYYFGHFYAGLCIEALPENERSQFQPGLAQLMIDRQETDGSWWDYPLYDYHQQYGTAFAIMTLLRCLPDDPGAIKATPETTAPVTNS